MQVLVVGGEHAFVHGTFASKLEKVGVTIGSHWDWTVRRPPSVIPKGCAGVVVLHDMVGHHLSNAAKDAAGTAALPFALVPRKFSAALPILQQAGIVSQEVDADEPIDEPTAETGPPPDEVSELQSWIHLVLETGFALSDREVAERVVDTTTDSLDAVMGEVARVRASLKADWSARKRTPHAERFFRTVAGNWARSKNIDPDDPDALNRLRAEARTVFGTYLPESVLADIGFHVWEMRGLFSRERVRTGIAEADRLYASMTPDERTRMREWLGDPNQDYADRGKILNHVRGRPLRAVGLFLRCNPDLSTTAIGRAYNRLTGSGLGPFYADAAQWMVGRTPAPVVVDIALGWNPTRTDTTEATPTVEPTSTVEATPTVEASPTVEPTPTVEATPGPNDDLNLRLLPAFWKSVEAVADGGTPDEIVRLVGEYAAALVERRELESVDAELRAAEEAFLAAQEKARVTRERIARMRGQ